MKTRWMTHGIVAAAITVAMGSVQAAAITGGGSTGDALDPLDLVIEKLALDGAAASPAPVTGAPAPRESGSVRMSALVAGVAPSSIPTGSEGGGETEASVAVPVPATAALLGVGLIAAGLIRRKAR